ncbi:MAG: alpha-E domain-containing protein [Salinisphaeraceae bacterium]|nr:alpha-E domain-containing protein [Salinisphaeraceae bacterium]
MLSRVAGNLYWFARYLERAENTARMINVNTYLLLDLPRLITPGWLPLIEITGNEKRFRQSYKEPSEENVLRFLISDTNNPDSILSTLRLARENLRTTRDVTPREAWEMINDIYYDVRDAGERAISRQHRHTTLTEMISDVQRIFGLLFTSTSHDTAFRFMRLGFHTEQADMTSRIIDVTSADLLPHQADELAPLQNIQWMSVLKSLTAYQMYRRHVRLRVNGPSVLQFLLQDPEFPRSVLFCLLRMGSQLESLPSSPEANQALKRLKCIVQDANVRSLSESGLHEFIDEIQQGLGEFHQRLAEAYFGG